MGYKIGTTFKGTYQLVPPPGARVGWGFKRLKRGLRKVGKGVKKLHTAPLKHGYRLTKKAHGLTTKVVKKLPGGKLALKVAMAPLKAGKFALKAMAKLAAKPLVKLFNKLAGRRAAYMAYQRTGKAIPSALDRRKGQQYAIDKFKKGGPIGALAIKILRAVGQAKVSGTGVDVRSWRQDAATCGMTGAEIAAAVAAILGALTALISQLNKKGEAPANPEAGGPPKQTEEAQPEQTEEAQPEQAEEQTEEGQNPEGDRPEDKG